MKKIISFIVIVFFVIFKSQLMVFAQGLSNSQPLGLLLRYNFGKRYPISFIKAKSGNYYINNGSNILKFNKSGDFVLKIVFPLRAKTVAFSINSFLVSEDENTFYINTGTSIIGYDSSAGKIIFNIPTIGSLLETDRKGNFYTQYQYHDVKTNNIINKLKVITPQSSVINYPTRIDLASENFPSIESKFYCYAIEAQKIYILPELADLSSNKPVTVSLQGLPSDRRVLLLGKINNNFIFEYPDYDKHMDVVAVFDSNYKLVKTHVISLLYADINLDFMKSDWLTDWPSGNIYSNSNKGDIYFIRNAKTGVYIYNLERFVK
jgi:hypothetical protein